MSKEAKKILYFDVETTGLDHKEHEIVQLGLVIEIGGEVKAEANYFMRPDRPESVTEGSLEITGKTMEEIMAYPERQQSYFDLTTLLGQHCDKFDSSDKFYPAGYNVGFDLDFLSSFFKGMNDPYLGSWINWRQIDPLRILHFMEAKGDIKLQDYKLETVCNYLGIKIKAHDAMSDIYATRELVHLLFEKVSINKLKSNRLND